MQKFRFVAVTVALFLTSTVYAQDKYYTKTGKIFFKGTKSPFEKIEAINKSGTCVLDTKTGNVQFSVLMKGFEFEKARMQEDFNENFVESDKFPKSDFKGQIVNNSEINYTKNGTYSAKVKGKLQIHGETNDVDVTGSIEVKEDKIISRATFIIQLSDYNIKIPSVVRDKIAESVNISVEFTMEPLKSR